MSRLLHIAQVIAAKKEEEIKNGRISVKLLGFGKEAPEIRKIPFVSPAASAKSGFYWQPDPGDYVVVAPLGGTNEWIALGSIYSSKNNPFKDQQKDKNEHRQLLSPGGNEITLDDKADAEKITIKTKGGCEIVISQESGKELISLTSKKDIKIDAKGKVFINAAEDVKVVAKGKAFVTSSAGITVESKGKLDIKATGPLKIKSTAAVEIQGAMVKIKADAVVDIKAGAALKLEGGAAAFLKGPLVKLG